MSNPLQPDYYKADGIEAKKVIKAFRLNYNLGNVVKYVLRHARKGTPLLDLQKAMEYLKEAIADQQMIDEEPGEVKAIKPLRPSTPWSVSLEEFMKAPHIDEEDDKFFEINNRVPAARHDGHDWVCTTDYDGLCVIPPNIFEHLQDGSLKNEGTDFALTRRYVSRSNAQFDLRQACRKYAQLFAARLGSL